MSSGDKQLTVLEHLVELRRVLVVSAIAVGITSGLVYGFFREDLYNLVTMPLQEYGVPLVFIGLSEAFMVQIKLAILAGFILSLPVVLSEVWRFIVPALKQEERYLFKILVPLSVLLFLVGASFAYLVVFRLAARFLLMIAGPDLQPMLSIGQYISFLISFLIPFGLAFELPLVMYFLARWGLVSGEWLAKNRRFAVVVIFIAAAALTPGPDIASQLLMAGPMLLLYEISIWVSKVADRRRQHISEAEHG